MIVPNSSCNLSDCLSTPILQTHLLSTKCNYVYSVTSGRSGGSTSLLAMIAAVWRDFQCVQVCKLHVTGVRNRRLLLLLLLLLLMMMMMMTMMMMVMILLRRLCVHSSRGT